MIVTEQLTKVFNGTVAVQNLNLKIPRGTVIGFVGPNGAGKTTTMRLIIGLIMPTSGSAYIDGLKTSDEQNIARLHSKIGYLPEHYGLYESLTIERNLEFFATLYNVNKQKIKENMKKLLTMLDIYNEKNKTIATLSKGMKQKVALSRAFIHEPDYIFLDEPTASLDPHSSKVVRDFIIEMKKQKKTIFINSHNLPEIESVCDKVAIFNKVLLGYDTPSNLAKKIFAHRICVELTTRIENVEKLKIDILTIKKINHIEITDRKLTFITSEPDTTNPEVVETLQKYGLKIRYIYEEKHSLEDIYFRVLSHPKNK